MKSNPPNNWTLTALGEIADWSSGGTPTAGNSSYYGGDIPWLIIGDLNDGYINSSAKTITQKGLENSSAKIAPIGSVMVAMYGSIGKLGIANIECATNQAIAFTKSIKGEIPNKFLFYYLFSQKAELLKLGKGGAQANISQTVLKAFPFPLPPLAEQSRIVAKLDEAMQRVEASQARLEKIPGLLKQFRQAVLAAAVSGRLTEAWRSEHPQEETGADLLARIRAERRAQWEEKQLARMKGKQLTLNENWKQKYKEPAEPDTSELSELPEGWVYTQLDNIAEMCLGKMLDSAKNQGILQPYLGNINVRWGTFDLEDLKQMRFTDAEDERYSIKKGDLVICEGGEPGRAAVWESDDSIKIQKALHRVRPYGNSLNSHFLYFNLRYDAESGQLKKYFTGTGIQHFTGKSLSRYSFPLPPIAEQQEIVRQVNHYFALADALEDRFEQAAAIVEQIPQALLAKAFSGQLVPQDPNDEPASVILERIKMAAANSPAKGIQKVRTKKADVIGAKQTRQKMKGKPIKTLPEFVERLTQLGGKAEPKQLLIEFNLQEDVDSFFELLRDGKAQGLLNVPTGIGGSIELA